MAKHLSHRDTERFQLLSQVSQQISSILEVNLLLEEIARLIQKTFGYYHVGIGLIEGDEVIYKVGAGVLWGQNGFEFKPARLKVGREGITGHVAGTGKPYLVSDIQLDPYYVQMEGSLTRSELTVPIMIKNKVSGVLDVQSENLDNFDETDLVFMMSLANQAGVAIENARLFSAQERRAEQFRLINEIGRHIGSVLELSDLLERIVQAIQNAFQFDLVEIGLVEGGDLVFKTRASRVIEHNFKPFRLKIGQEGITGWVAAHSMPLVIPDVSQDERYLRFSHHETRSELAVPIITKGVVTGVLNLQSSQVNAFDESDVELMQTVATQAGVAIENAHLYEQARQVAVLEERQRLARELHDSVTQSLFGISLYSEAAQETLLKGNQSETDEHLREIHTSAHEALAEMRLLIYELRPPVLEKEGLAAALEARLASVEGRSGLMTKFSYQFSERLPVWMEQGLYRIAHDALNNALKHANAKNIQIILDQTDKIIWMEIQDDGVGFDPKKACQPGCMGLSTMQERVSSMNGKLIIDSKPGHGARIRVEIRQE